jgi:hypothetical protein
MKSPPLKFAAQALNHPGKLKGPRCGYDGPERTSRIVFNGAPDTSQRPGTADPAARFYYSQRTLSTSQGCHLGWSVGQLSLKCLYSNQTLLNYFPVF